MSTTAASTNSYATRKPVMKSTAKLPPVHYSHRGNPLVYFIAVCLVVIVLAPAVFIIFGGFRTNSQITVDPAGLPNPWNITNYLNVLSSGTFWPQLLNSLIVALSTTVGVVVLGLMVGFGLARYSFRGNSLTYMLFAAGLMFPMTVAITPLYILIRLIGLLNTLPGLILPGIAFSLPTTVIILVPFLRAIPKEMEEAASIDGCSRLGFFWRMVLPLSVPGVITVGILAFVSSWNSYMLPLYVINDPAKYTLPLGVQSFATAHSVDTAQVLAFTSLSMLPALVFFSLFERRIVGGLTGAVKG